MESLYQGKNEQIKYHSGALIRYVLPNGPAASGGLKVGDLIISIGNKSITGAASVVNEINNNGDKKPMVFVVLRNNQKLKIIITPTDMNNLSRRKK